MNALLLSAILGVVMMFSGIVLKQKSAVRNVAVAGMVLLLLVNVLEMCGNVFFKIDTKGMMSFDRFALLFNTIVFAATLIYSETGTTKHPNNSAAGRPENGISFPGGSRKKD